MRPGLYLLRERDGRRLPVVVHEAGHGVVAGEEVSAEVIRGHFYAGRLKPASVAEFEVAVEALGRARGRLDQAPPAVLPQAPAGQREPLVIAAPPVPARTVDLTRAAELLAAARQLGPSVDVTSAAELSYQLRAEARRIEAAVEAALADLRAALAEASARAAAIDATLLEAARSAEALVREQLLELGLQRVTTPGGVTAAIRHGTPEVVVTDKRAAAAALLDEIDDAAVLKAARAAVRAGRTVPGVEVRPRVEARVTGPRGGAS